jgi:hypothetical protein
MPGKSKGFQELDIIGCGSYYQMNENMVLSESCEQILSYWLSGVCVYTPHLDSINQCLQREIIRTLDVNCDHT